MEYGKYLGIDLGTTNTVVAIGKKDIYGHVKPEVIEIIQYVNDDEESTRELPSIMYVDRNSNEIIIGAEGKNKRFQDSSRVIYNAKRYMGQEDEWEIDDRKYKAKDVAGEILKHCRQVLKNDYNEEFDSVVITVPASFNASQTQDTIEAAMMAGFNKEGIKVLHEPTAALLDYVNEQTILGEDSRSVDFSRKTRVMVFDLGGGTCDISVIDVQQQNKSVDFEEKAIGRYEDLGGIDFDALVAQGLLNDFFKKNDIKEVDYSEENLDDFYEDNAKELGFNKDDLIGMFNKVRLFAEEGKEFISTKTENKLRTESLDFDGIVKKKNIMNFFKGESYRFELSKEEFDRYTEKLYSLSDKKSLTQSDLMQNKSILRPIEDTFKHYNIDRDSIDYIFLTGGMTKYLTVREKISSLINKPILTPYNAMHAVARGAAIYHYYLIDIENNSEENRKVITPKAVLSEAILIDINEGLPEVILHKNQIFPSSGLLEGRFKTTSPAGIRIDLYSGDSAYDSNLRIQRSYSKEFDVPIVSGTPFDVEYAINENKVIEIRLLMHDQYKQIIEITMDQETLSQTKETV